MDSPNDMIRWRLGWVNVLRYIKRVRWNIKL